MNTFSLFALTTIALVGVQPFASAQQVDLKPRWNVGTTYLQEMKMQQETKMNLGGQQMNQAVRTSQEVATRVAPHEDPKLKRLTQKYQRMTMDMEMAGQKMHFDSSKPDDTVDPMGIGKALGPLVGKELRLVVDANNELTDVENVEEITAPLAAANPMAAQMMKGMFNKDVIAQSFKQTGLKALPGKPVNPGDSWPYSITMTLPQMGVIKLDGKYTYKGMSDHNGAKCAELAEQGTVAMDLNPGGGAAPGGEGMPAPGMNIKVESGTVAGTVWFDPALGAPRETTTTQALVMQMPNPITPNETMKIPMTQTITQKLLSTEGGK